MYPRSSIIHEIEFAIQKKNVIYLYTIVSLKICNKSPNRNKLLKNKKGDIKQVM